MGARIPRSSMTAAFKVLTAVEKLLWKGMAKEFWLKPYYNCREQGFHIGSMEGGISFSEARSSDEIVVYVAHGNAVRMSKETGLGFHDSMIPNDKTWEHRTYFHYNEVDKAAKFIVSQMQIMYLETMKSRNEYCESKVKKQLQKI